MGQRMDRTALTLCFAALIPSGAWAATIVTPTAVRGIPSGINAPITGTLQTPLSAPSLGGLSGLSAPTLTPVLSLTPQLSVLPSLAAPASPVKAMDAASQQAFRPALAAEPVAPQSPGAQAAATVGRISHEVGGMLEAAGPMEKAAPESAQGTGAEVFRALTRGPAEISGVLAEPAPAAAQPNLTLTQQKMLHTLTQVASIFSDQYAPVEWKKEQFQLDLKREYDKAKASIVSNPKLTTPQFQDLVFAFVAAMRDYHVNVSVISTERAKLPLLIMKAGGKYVIARVDRAKLPAKDFPFQAGDEVVEFGGKPTAEAVGALAKKLGGNTKETDLRLAELFLTNRFRGRGDVVPQGPISLKISDRRGKVQEIQLAWDYTPEKIPQNVPVRDAGLLAPGTPESLPMAGIDDLPGETSPEGFKSLLGRFFANAVHPLVRFFKEMTAAAPENPFGLGAKKSYVPALGEVVWQAKEDNPFHAYIFKTKDGRQVGFIRVPSYDGGRDEVEAFGKIMARFQKQTDSLVIDQVNNPGGAVFYLYALVSHLTDKPMPAPKHRIIADESDAMWAVDFLEKVDNPMFRMLGQLDPGDEWAGYPVTTQFWDLMKQFARFILSELGAGRRLTGLTHLWGVDAINPAPNARQRYTKPILLLTNELDFSGGDFFPAILQDNKRATILGVRTSGAGGAVKGYSLPNQFGVSDLSATWTIAQRADGKPIENLGVTPDIGYELTQKDFRTGFAEYRRAILKALAGLLK